MKHSGKRVENLILKDLNDTAHPHSKMHGDSPQRKKACNGENRRNSRSKEKSKKTPHCFGDVFGKLANMWK